MFKWLSTSVLIKNIIKFFLDECLPPIVRDNRLFFQLLLKLYDDRIDLDFKRKAPFMSDEEFISAYKDFHPITKPYITKRQTSFLLDNIVGNTILEVGAGSGYFSILASKKGFDVLATDVSEENLNIIQKNAAIAGVKIKTRIADIESLPFPDKSFDTVVSTYTLEHIRKPYVAVQELLRVCRYCVMVIVPKERYYRYTANYHLNFWGGTEQIILLFGLKRCDCRIIDQAICYKGYVD